MFFSKKIKKIKKDRDPIEELPSFKLEVSKPVLSVDIYEEAKTTALKQLARKELSAQLLEWMYPGYENAAHNIEKLQEEYNQLPLEVAVLYKNEGNKKLKTKFSFLRYEEPSRSDGGGHIEFGVLSLILPYSFDMVDITNKLMKETFPDG